MEAAMRNRRFEQMWGQFENSIYRNADRIAQHDANIRAQQIEWSLRNAKPSGDLGNGRLADYNDIQNAGLLTGRGLVIGGFGGKLMTYMGDGSLITLLRAGGGKNVSFIFPNMLYVTSRSIVVIDIKDGENSYVSSQFRAKKLGYECIYLNPFGLHGFPNTSINPLSRLLDLKYAGIKIDSEFDEIAEILIPTPKSKSDNGWVYSGAQQIISWLLQYFVTDHPTKLNPGWIWRFANMGGTELEEFFSFAKTSSDETIASRAHKYEAMIKDAPKEWSAYISEITKAVNEFRPDTSIERATRYNQFDFGDLKKRKIIVYIILPSAKIPATQKWIGLGVNHAIETIAAANGDIPVTIFLDELPQYYSPAIAKALRLYRARGINLWMFAQTRQSLYDYYSKDLVTEFENQAAVSVYKNVTEPSLLKDIETWSGTKTILNRNFGHSGGVQQSGNAGLSETKRSVLQSEDILALNQGKHILRIADMPRLIVADTVPYYQIPEWNKAIKDVREMHKRGAEIIAPDWGNDE